MILFDAIGPGPHPCHWCGNTINWVVGGQTRKGSLVVDHVDENWRNNNLTNLVPSCQRCNVRRSMAKVIKDGEPFVAQAGNQKARGIERLCQTCGTTFLTPPARLKRRPNSGRYCSLECLWNRNG